MKIITTFFAVLVFCLMIVSVSNAQTNNSADKPKDRPLKIKSKPRVSLGDCRESQGTTRIRATFDKSGKITAVEMIVSSGCESFDKNALRAAKGIKFQPEIKNGELITVSKQVEYSFAKY
jgi:TonB family protein